MRDVRQMPSSFATAFSGRWKNCSRGGHTREGHAAASTAKAGAQHGPRNRRGRPEMVTQHPTMQLVTRSLSLAFRRRKGTFESSSSLKSLVIPILLGRYSHRFPGRARQRVPAGFAAGGRPKKCISLLPLPPLSSAVPRKTPSRDSRWPGQCDVIFKRNTPHGAQATLPFPERPTPN